MLQKTLLAVEGLGRQLDPELDLWSTAKPFLERWMSEEIGWRGLLAQLRAEAPYWAKLVPQLPRLAHEFLARGNDDRLAPLLARLAAESRSQTVWLGVIAALAATIALLLASRFF